MFEHSGVRPLPLVDATLPELFEAQAARTPEATAVVFESAALSYAELNARASRLAHCLIDHGVGPEHLVGVALPRSLDLVVATLGVLKAGAACLPLDPELPSGRTAHMIGDARPSVLISDRESSRRLGNATRGGADPGAPVSLLLDDPVTAEEISQHSQRDPGAGERGRVMTDHAAYVLYTSGATGTPKGVVITHHNVVHLFPGSELGNEFGPHDAWSLLHSCSGRVSVWEFWGALLHGGRLVVVPEPVSRSSRGLLEFLVRRRITVFNQAPSAFHRLVKADQESPELGARLALRQVILGGEPLELSTLESWCSRRLGRQPTLLVAYGLSEATAYATHLELGRDLVARHRGSPIGADDLRVQVLDDKLQPVPRGGVGELHVGGPGVARGYLGQRGLTGQYFVADPWGLPGDRMVRSGDLVRRNDDDVLDFVGRVAHTMRRAESPSDQSYFALINDHDQYSLWPAVVEVPAGWEIAYGPADRQSCVDHIENQWTDMRPAGPPRHTRDQTTRAD